MSEAAALSRRARELAGSDSLALTTRERSLTLRFAANRPTQATAIDDVSLELALVRGGHVGRAETNSVEDAALEECALRAAAAADSAAAGGAGAYPGFPAAGEPHAAAGGGWDAATAALDPDLGGSALAAAFAVAREAGLEAHGIWTVAEVERALVSPGGERSESRTDAFMKVICFASEGGPDGRRRSGYAARTGAAAGEIDARALAECAAAKAALGGPAAELPPGEYPVVFEPHAVGELLELLAGAAFNGLAHAEGSGALAGRLGRRVAAPAINLSDSPFFAHTLPRGFDAEGTSKAPLPLIQDGVAHRVVHDVRSGALAGELSTGHALAPGGDPYGPRPTNLVLGGGGAAGTDELCAPIERGIYVTRLWYGNVVRPKETLVTAVTRDGTFLIEDGRIARPLRDLRLTDSVLGILSRTQALTGEQALASDGEFYGRRFASGVVCPALRAGAVRFTA